MVGGGEPFYVNFGSTGTHWSEIADFQAIFARSASAVTHSEKSSINTNRKSTTRLSMSLSWSLSPPLGGLNKRKTADFLQIALRLKTVCYKVSLCENCQRQNCKAFIGLTIHAEMIGGGNPFYVKLWIKLTALERNRRFSISFRSWRLSCNT